MSGLRVLHVVPYYEDAWAYGGIPRLAAAMTRGLARLGHDVTVCTTDVCDRTSRMPRIGRQSPVPGLRVVVFANLSNRLAYHWQFFTPIGMAAYLHRRAREFDIAHLHACRNAPVAIAARTLRRFGVPYVLSPNGTAPALERRILAKRAFDWIDGGRTLNGAARVLAVSEAERRQLQLLGVPGSRIVVVPNPIDQDELEPQPAALRFRERHRIQAAPLILFLGKLTPRKGVDVLLRAFHEIAIPGAGLVIAGNDMGAGTAIDRLTAHLGLQTRTQRLGLLRGSERFDALAAADVVVYPSRDEVFGLVAAEAILCGTPVVVCDDSGCGEVVAGVGGGICVPYGNPSALAKAIATVLEAGGAWKARASAAGALVRERFGSSAVCRQLDDVYRDVLLRHRRAA